ncbi:MAG: quinol:cytochrome C oxidoreductase [Bacteroidetes bacterium]|nr:quinol:cytochrome C oxidoreductase [Bacteroidota bacterium]
MSESHTIVADEKYVFKSETRNRLMIIFALGLLLFIVGVFMAKSGGGHEEHKAAIDISQNLTASIAHDGEHGDAAEEHAGTAPWLKRVYTTLWMNNVFFTGLAVIGLFFVAIQYAAQAGWSVGVRRLPLAMAHWLPIAGVLMLVIWFVVKGDVFHWTHAELYDPQSDHYDKVIDAKGGFFYWPGKHGAFPIFYILRMVLFFGLWYLFFSWIKREMTAEDMDGNVQHWKNSRKYSAIFLVIFAVSSSVAAWDWVMSIDTHWYSTMTGWYLFASWWVTGLAMITYLTVLLKDAGYLKIVNANHLHDLGKFVFAFSIFWTYIWFSQFLLIFYANIPEETVYFIQRRTVSPYSWIFFANLILNFVLPFLLLMTRDAKRHLTMLKVVCPIVIVGHWIDHFNMITPGVMQHDGGLGLLEIGMAMMFLAAFLMITFSSLTKFALVPKNDPMLQESLGHHI